MRITIVGVGALGSHLVQFIRNIDAEITIIDFDRVEQKNVSAQFHSKPSVGKKKTEGLKQSMKFLYNRKVHANSNKLTKDNVLQLLLTDLVIDCLDNGEGRRIIQEHVRETSTACLHGALAADGGFGRVVWDEDFVIDDEGDGDAPTCEDGEHLPFIVITAGYLARATQRFVADGIKVSYSISPGGVIKH